MPRIDGLAIGLFVTPCTIAPATAKLSPQMSTACGNCGVFSHTAVFLSMVPLFLAKNRLTPSEREPVGTNKVLRNR